MFDNLNPRYLPHMDDPDVLLMGLSPMEGQLWIETDQDIGRYHQHKLQQRASRGNGVYQCLQSSLPAQRELSGMLLEHLLTQRESYRQEGDRLRCIPGQFTAQIDGDEPLWSSSLWVADDLVIMEKTAGAYSLTAASLCSPSHWRLAEKFGRTMREIHDPIPGFHQRLTPRVDRFFEHLRPKHPVVRFNWSVQADDALHQDPDQEIKIHPDTPLYYRTERQSLVRLPDTGAIAFTIRVYLHSLDTLRHIDRALPNLFAAIDGTPTPLSQYKGFNELAPALQKYRA